MKLCTAYKSLALPSYILIGLIFLAWENLTGSVLGMYHLELRRTLWGIVYYSVLFLFFGGISEAVNYIYSRWFPQYRWFGQKHLWFLTIVVLFLGADLSRESLIALFNIQSIQLRYTIILLWIPAILGIGCLANVMLSKPARSDRLLVSHRILTVFFAAILYLIISAKITYRYFQVDPLSAPNVLLQPLFLIGSLTIVWFIHKFTRSRLSFQSVLIVVPMALITIVVAFPTGLAPIKNANSHPLKASNANPNIIIMLFDALRADHVGAINPECHLTPTIDSLAALGRVYPHCYATSTWTLPSVGAILTSRLPDKLGLLEDAALPRLVPTLADFLKKRGYYTAALSANLHISPTFGFDRSFDEFHYLRGKERKQLFLPLRLLLPPDDFLDELAYQMDFISTDYLMADHEQMNHQAANILSRVSSKPLFLYLHFMEPHNPYRSVPFSGALLDLNVLKVEAGLVKSSTRRAARSGIGIVNKNRDYVIKTLHRRYDDGVTTVDRAVAEMLQNLKRLGLADNTIIIITGDHGEAFFEHGRPNHGHSLFEELVRVPLIIYIPPGCPVHLPEQAGMVSHLDIAPTVLGLAGIKDSIPEMEGRSLLQNYPDSSRPVYMALDVGETVQRGVRAGSYKLISEKNLRTQETKTLLFDLSVDKGERVNLYPEKKELADSLDMYLEEVFDQDAVRLHGEPPALTPQEIEKFRALGYTQ